MLTQNTWKRVIRALCGHEQAEILLQDERWAHLERRPTVAWSRQLPCRNERVDSSGYMMPTGFRLRHGK